MKKMNGKRFGLWLAFALCLTLGLCLLAGCVTSPDVDDTTVDTTVAGDPTDEPTAAPTEDPTDDATEAPTDDGTEAPTDDVTEAPSEELKGWEQDTGKFNDGNVDYIKEVVTTILDAFPDDQLGKVMQSGSKGVNTLLDADFADNDATIGGLAAPRSNDACVVVDGVFHMPYDPNSADKIVADGWTTWGLVPTASVKDNKQVQLSLNWSIVSRGSGAWMTAIWGCYVSNYTGKIPDGPGDGLWISFNPANDTISIYHPDQGSWPAGIVGVKVEKGILGGQIKTDIVCQSDYTTTVYVTPAGSDTARAVVTIRFADGKMRVYDEANDMKHESDCTTSSLKGDNFTLFTHAGGGVKIDDLQILAASKGEVLENTTITAVPTEGNTLGLDITDKTGLVSICYSVWFDAILGNKGGTVDNWHNITEVLAGKQEWGGVPSFHYWAKPAQGYYASSNKAVIRTHMTQLYTAGVDFIIIDLTNAGDGYLTNAALWTSYIQQPMDAICDTIMEMRAEGLGTPYVVFWVGDGEGPLYQELYDKYHNVEKWKDCFVYWDNKPFMLTTHKTPEAFPLKDLYTVRSMWGLGVDYNGGQWCFLSINNWHKFSKAADGSVEQVSVAVASQETYMSRLDTAHGREGGMFWYAQWLCAFEHQPKIVTLTWWNEWTAQRIDIGGEYIFTDAYNQEYSRDIEPMEGGHGDQYYQWMIRYISAYKGGLECPVLIEDEYRDQLEDFMKKYERGLN